jgi:hypothetical protein
VSVITCDRADLAWALRAVLPHVLRDRGCLPALEGVRLEVAAASKLLYVVATDRYTLGVATVPVTGDLEPAATVIDAGDVREMLRRLKAKGECELAVYDDGEVCLDWRARWQQPTTLEFPDWRGLLAPALRYPPMVPGPRHAWNPEYLARFAPAARECVPLVFMPVAWHGRDGHPPAPMTVVVGEDFTGLAMGARDGPLDAPAALRRWRQLLPAGGTA